MLVFILTVLFLAFPLIALILFWLNLFFYANDFSKKTVSLPKKLNKILIIFPHPDDEVLTCSGLMAKAKEQDTLTTLVVLTKGEKGTSEGKEEKSLKAIREKELNKVGQIYGVGKTILKDMGDGELVEKQKKVEEFVKEVITQEKPSLVITYDLSGLYGHADHIAVSRAVTKVVKTIGNVQLWYTSLPRRVYKLIKLPVEMAKNKVFIENRKFPTHKIYIGINIYKKIKALYTYRSQYFAFRKGYPKPFPLWFFVSIMLFEYFHEV
jgi:LmbE family N-acetylglucosaminyl deacetylase